MHKISAVFIVLIGTLFFSSPLIASASDSYGCAQFSEEVSSDLKPTCHQNVHYTPNYPPIACPKDQFNARDWHDSFCVPCSDGVALKTTTKEECLKCPTRYIAPNGLCAQKKCTSSQFTQEYDCVDCTQNYALSVKSPKDQASCLTCPNRYITADIRCAKKCTADQFKNEESSCFDCSAEKAQKIGTPQELIDLCRACPERRYIAETKLCAKKCEKNHFMNEDAQCYPCSNPLHVFIGTQPDIVADCLSCGRKMQDGYCVLPCGPNQFQVNGTCHSCEEPKGIYLSRSPFETNECDSCPNRYVEDSWCVLKTSKDNFRDTYGNIYACADEKTQFVGTDARAIASCKACQNGRFVSKTGYCVKPCPEQDQFRSNGVFCLTCREGTKPNADLSKCE